MFQIQQATYGSDFEIGVATQGDNMIIPVTGNLGGTKENPIPIGRGCFSQEDGPMAEFNIPPVQTEEEWADYFDYCIQKGSAILNQAGLEFKIFSSHEYTDSQLDDNDLRTLGCSTSNDAYTGEENRPDGMFTNMRTCGVHFHIGFLDKYNDSKFSFDDARMIAQYCDLLLGVPSLILDPDTKRRELYGKAGDFRVKTLYNDDTGINIQLFEYRTLGGNLLKDSNIIKWCFNQLKEVVKQFNAGSELPDGLLIRETINTSDIETAKLLIERFNIKLLDN